ncbi:MAG: CvpA family protein [Treponema sp.]|nr:CvpA family protein [Treponema sp.]
MNLPIIDYFFLGILVFCIIMGVVKGFVDSVFDKAAPVLSVIASFLFYKPASALFEGVIAKPIFRSLVAFLAIFVAVFLITKLVQAILSKFFENQVMGGLNRALGFLFGVAEGAAIIFFILFVISWQPFFDLSSVCERSFFYGLLSPFLPSISSLKKTEVSAIGSVLGGLHV